MNTSSPSLSPLFRPSPMFPSSSSSVLFESKFAEEEKSFELNHCSYAENFSFETKNELARSFHIPEEFQLATSSSFPSLPGQSAQSSSSFQPLVLCPELFLKNHIALVLKKKIYVLNQEEKVHLFQHVFDQCLTEFCSKIYREKNDLMAKTQTCQFIWFFEFFAVFLVNSHLFKTILISEVPFSDAASLENNQFPPVRQDPILPSGDQQNLVKEKLVKCLNVEFSSFSHLTHYVLTLEESDLCKVAFPSLFKKKKIAYTFPVRSPSTIFSELSENVFTCSTLGENAFEETNELDVYFFVSGILMNNFLCFDPLLAFVKEKGSIHFLEKIETKDIWLVSKLQLQQHPYFSQSYELCQKKIILNQVSRKILSSNKYFFGQELSRTSIESLKLDLEKLAKQTTVFRSLEEAELLFCSDLKFFVSFYLPNNAEKEHKVFCTTFAQEANQDICTQTTQEHILDQKFLFEEQKKIDQMVAEARQKEAELDKQIEEQKQKEKLEKEQKEALQKKEENKKIELQTVKEKSHQIFQKIKQQAAERHQVKEETQTTSIQTKEEDKEQEQEQEQEISVISLFETQLHEMNIEEDESKNQIEQTAEVQTDSNTKLVVQPKPKKNKMYTKKQERPMPTNSNNSQLVSNKIFGGPAQKTFQKSLQNLNESDLIDWNVLEILIEVISSCYFRFFKVKKLKKTKVCSISCSIYDGLNDSILEYLLDKISANKKELQQYKKEDIQQVDFDHIHFEFENRAKTHKFSLSFKRSS